MGGRQQGIRRKKAYPYLTLADRTREKEIKKDADSTALSAGTDLPKGEKGDKNGSAL